MREHRRRDVVRDGLEDRPAPFAGVRDPALDVREVGALFLEGALRQLEEPRPDDAPLEPHARDLVKIEAELARVQELEPLAVGLHHPVLDAVVDHLHEVARTGAPEVRPAVRWRERVEHRLRDRDRVRRPADHHAVAHLQPPDPAGDADVEETESLRGVLLGALHRVAEVTVRAVDEHVARRRVRGELVERVIGDLARGHHRPQHARRLELFHHVLDRGRADRAVAHGFLHRLGATVPRDDAMLAAREPRHHVPAHPPESVEAYLTHGSQPAPSLVEVDQRP